MHQHALHYSPTLWTHTAELVSEAQQYSQVTPLQVSLLYELCSIGDKRKGTISLWDFQQLLPERTRALRREESHPPTVISELGPLDRTVSDDCVFPSYMYMY